MKEAYEKQKKFNTNLPRVIDKNELKILEVVGVGGFGRVCRGFWNSKEVALKMVGEQNSKQLEREARMFCFFKHENIISLMVHLSTFFNLYSFD